MPAYFWVPFLVSAVAAYPVLGMLRAMKSRQTIYEHAPETHQVKQGTPTMGGIIILCGLLAGLLMFPRPWWAAFVLVLGFALIGFLDDYVVPRVYNTKRGLGWKQKFVAEVVVAVGGLLTLTQRPSDLVVGTLVILFCANAYNFADGLDGLAGSTLLGFVAGLGCIGVLVGVPTVLAMCLVLAGATLPFLFLNAPPAKVFMGDVGSMPLGALLGLLVLGLWSTNPSVPRAVVLAVLGLMLVVELVPVPLQVGYYKLTKKRLFPFTPIHHAFEKKGWKETRVVATFAIAQLVFSALAVSLAWWWA